ncbi:MAG: hypothetical protein IKR76_03715 [Ruminococcus sp.]|nr:hypothetical protein [Ruminococcus sp.]
MRTLTDELKIYELSTIWKEAEYNFAFWDKVDINWDEEYKKALPRVLAAKDIYDYYQELMRFVSMLCDGHTGVTMPMDIMQDAQYYSMLPVLLFGFEGKIAVINTTEEYKDIVPLYSVLKKINGTDAAEYIKDNCYPYIWHANEAACSFSALSELILGRVGSTLDMTFEHEGRTFEETLTREAPAQMKWCSIDQPFKDDISKELIAQGGTFKAEMREDRIAVLKFTSFDDNNMPEEIYTHFDRLKEAKAFIIDVRGNTGGNSDNADKIAAMFIDGDFDSCGAEEQIYEPAHKAWGIYRDDLKDITPGELEERYSDEGSIKDYKMCRHIYYKRDITKKENHAPGRLKAPIAVLMNEYTFSAGEDFIDVMKAHTDAVFIGTNTAGSSGQPLQISLESGGSFRICTRRCFAQNGEEIYNKGFSPDIKIAQTLESYTAGLDKAMEKAVNILKEKT